jgi:hypothetical protein
MEYDLLIFAVLTTGAVLIVNQLARIVRTSMMHRTIREAINRDNAAVPALLEGIEEKPAPSSDDRTGLVLLALGAAVFLFGVIQGDAEDIRNMGGIALFPALVGAALLGRFWYLRRSAG